MKKIKKFLKPDIRKGFIFLLIVLFFVSLWLYVFINSLPIFVTGTQVFSEIFCQYRITSADCSITAEQKNQTYSDLNQRIDYLNQRYSNLFIISIIHDLANYVIPANSFSCFLHPKTLEGLGSENQFSVLGYTQTCDSSTVIRLIINIFIIYVLSCVIAYGFDKRKG